MQAGLQVHVIAYGGSKTNAAITKHQNIRVHTIPELYVQNARSSRHFDAACEAGQRHDVVCRRQLAHVLPRSVALIIKAAFQAFMLLFMMIFWLPSPDTLLLQV